MRRALAFHVSSLFVASLAWSACSGAHYGATDADLQRARHAAPEGATVFNHECAGCHGTRGESVSSAPRILGEGALPEVPRARATNADPAAGDPELLKLQAQSRPPGAPWRDPFVTAQDLFDYVSQHMPLPQARAGTLAEGDYWAVIDFMLRAHGVAVPDGGVTRANASSIALTRSP